MDFSRRKKQEKTGHETADSDTLPIVLDGPFLKLGDENIELIAKVLPQVSEQVIILYVEKGLGVYKVRCLTLEADITLIKNRKNHLQRSNRQGGDSLMENYKFFNDPYKFSGKHAVW